MENKNIKIEIKTWLGRALFAYESENNTIKQTLEKAVSDSANLSDANLRGANLRGADLSDADLSVADLRVADLSGVDLSGADLRGANLSGANLSAIRNDFWDVLLRAQNEISALRLALAEGRVNGSTYSGDCACLVGTIANARHCDYNHLGSLRPDSSRPIERFLLSIKPGNTPENNAAAAIVVEWIDEFTSLTSIPVAL